jgi:ATP-binding cassette, subfamily B, bacterial PglK
MLSIWHKVQDLLEPRERRTFYVLIALMILSTIAEVISITAILPLLTILARPDIVDSNALLAGVKAGMDFRTIAEFNIFLSLIVFGAIFTGLLIKALGAYAMTRFATMRGYTISSRLLQAYLRQPYAWHLRRNSAELARVMLSEVGDVVGRIIVPLTMLISNLMLVLAIVLMFLLIDPVIAVAASVGMGAVYVLIYLAAKGSLARAGQQSLTASRERFKLTHEILGGIKELKLMGLEPAYLERYRIPTLIFSRAAARSSVISQVPRYMLEALAFGTMMAVALYLMAREGGDITAVVPTLGVLAFGVLRLLPSLQAVYFHLSAIRGSIPTLDHLHGEYVDVVIRQAGARPLVDSRPLPLDQSFALDAVSYRYEGADRLALDNVSLVFPARTTIGIVGESGAGKSTLIDVMLGLLVPQQGRLLVDGVALTDDNLRGWQKSMGYVPQSIYLFDSTVAANIAYGIPLDQIDLDAVERAARLAALHDFVMTDMPDGYQTLIGERGVRLSGGQRQRIGIARALYRDPSLLMFDEATSALDTLTEQAVMEAVRTLGGQKTVVMIAHRLSTVRDCDIIFLFEKGRLLMSGTYTELVARNETFRKMAAAS